MEELQEVIDVYTPGSFLSRVWRSILVNDGYIRHIRPLTNAYIDRLRKTLETSNTKLIVSRGNIYGKVIAKEMTWKNLVVILKNILGIRDITLTVTLVSEEEKDYTVSGLNGELLSRLWILIKKDYTSEELDDLLKDYLDRNKDNPKADNKTNLMKKITATNKVTWNTIVFLVDELLCCKKIIFNAKIEMKPGLYSTHKLDYYLKG